MASLLFTTLLGLVLYIFVGSFGFPGESLSVLSVGALAASAAQLVFVIIIVAAASIAGDILVYEIARKFSPWVLRQLERWKPYKQNEKRIRRLLSKSEFSFVFLTRFLFTAFGSLASYISGLDQLDRRVYVTAVIAGDTLYAAIYGVLGFLFKETWTDLYALIGNLSVIVVLFCLIGMLVFWYWRATHRK